MEENECHGTFPPLAHRLHTNYNVCLLGVCLLWCLLICLFYFICLLLFCFVLFCCFVCLLLIVVVDCWCCLFLIYFGFFFFPQTVLSIDICFIETTHTQNKHPDKQTNRITSTDKSIKKINKKKGKTKQTRETDQIDERVQTVQKTNSCIIFNTIIL